ncbi:MAG: hypothetical protein CL961_06890 [Euryarchaeota archaeon]|nr:hypothetical protein [Euryarchaeota archaeon]|tara:strand:- start:860 stop:2635 length:1776 start_codon:yes stop_codon:yes gene_type:complete
MAKQSVFTHDILPRIRADHPVLSVITHEWERLTNMLIDASEELDRRLLRWSNAHMRIEELITDEEGGLSWHDLKGPKGEIILSPVFDDAVTMQLDGDGNPDYVSGRVGRCAPDYVMWWYREQPWLQNSILWMEDLTPYLDMTAHAATSTTRRDLVRRIRQFCASDYETTDKTIVMSFPEPYLPVELEKDVEQFTLPLPDVSTLEKIFDATFDQWNDKNQDNQVVDPQREIKDKIVVSALGLTAQESTSAFKQIFARMVYGEPSRNTLENSDVKVVNEQKAQIINKTGVLEYIDASESIKDIGGMENLKHWLTVHKGSLQDETDPPRGLLMMGVPGCGKSMMAKAVAADWELPLLALKASNIFDKYVGESEGKISRALAIAEAISPCVLWVDEIEKLLAGSGGDGSLDSGVSSRIGGTILTWMSDKEAPVFVVATANNPERLDPAYVRRGRFDERFFIDLPGVKAREEIFAHHVAKRFPDIDLATLKLDMLAKQANGFTGAEIEALIVEAKNFARSQNSALTAEILHQCLNDMTPDSVAMTATISHIRQLWGGDRARRADNEDPVNLKDGKAYDKSIEEAVEKQRQGNFRRY